MTFDAPRILELLPSIHATILSIYGAAIPAFYFYAYEKVKKARDELTEIISEVRPSFSGLSPIPDNLNIYTEKGKFDWGEKADMFLIESMSFNHNRYINNEELSKKVSTFLNFLGGVLSHPPCFGINFCQKYTSPNEINISSNDIQEIYETIRLLHHRVFVFRPSFYELCRQADAYMKEKTTKEIADALKNSTKPHESLMSSPEVASFVQERDKQFYESFIHNENYAKNLEIIKQKYEFILNTAIPILKEKCVEYERWRDLFSIKKRVKQSLKYLSIGMLVGIVLPLVMSLTFKGRTNFDSPVMISLEFTLLIAPFIIYSIIIYGYYKEINKSNTL
ncbi:hypothetical protein ABK696_00585 [Klebsiella pneumoniae]|uniref:hypothetical protein n=1 Tax=Klebsiella pneumoniae TaxID=573 RepID=UPI00375062F5